MPFQNFINKMALNPKQLFMIDGFGAVLSAFSLGVILTRFENIFGMPQKELQYLALAAVIFAVYDLICFYRVGKNWQPFLRGIAFANLTYCFISIGAVIYFFQRLTILGLTYFVLEFIILFILIFIELKTAAK